MGATIFSEKASPRLTDRTLALITLLTIIIAWFLGGLRSERDIAPYFNRLFPAADRFVSLSKGGFAAYHTQEGNERLIGYITTAESNGYGGPMKVAVAVSPEGTLIHFVIIDQRETDSFLAQVLNSEWYASLTGKDVTSFFNSENDINAVSGATHSSHALMDAIRLSTRKIAVQELNISVPSEAHPRIRFGFLEISIMTLLLIGLFGHVRRIKIKKQLQWATMISGLIILGFIYNSPLTLARITGPLMGFWPQWQTHLFLYILLGGIVFGLMVSNKNPYCPWFCPFGAFQECLGAIGNAKAHTPQHLKRFSRWIPRLLAWLAIVLALLFRNSSISSYEIFGMLFKFIGSKIQFILLCIIIITSLFIKRPWCLYLCPVAQVIGYLKFMRNWIKGICQNATQKMVPK